MDPLPYGSDPPLWYDTNPLSQLENDSPSLPRPVVSQVITEFDSPVADPSQQK